MQMMLEGNIVYFDGKENLAADIMMLVDMALRQELLVVRHKEGWSRLIKEVLIANQVVLPQSTRASKMRQAHQHQ